MTMWTDKKRDIQYYRSMFIKSIKFNGATFSADIAPLDDVATMTIEWTHSPIDAMEMPQDLGTWLYKHGYGVTVTLSITLDGMPDEEEPDQ